VSRSFAVLVNPASASGRPLKLLPVVRRELEGRGAPHRVVETKSLEHAKEEARAAADAGETVMTMGGDGLVGPVAGELRHRGVLAVIRAGRGNDFARVLEIPEDPKEAVRLAVEGEERLLDLGEADGVPFATIATLGFDSVANRMANEARFVPGPLVYVYAGIRTLATWRPAPFAVTVDGERHEFEGYSVAVGNTKAYGGGLFLIPPAEPDDGEFDVILIKRHAKWRFFRGIFRTMKGTHLEPDITPILRGKVVEISAEPRFAVYADGDQIADTPVRMTVDPRCLRVIAPPPKG
jgi:YegS/Rv2252/BmrU family lipid kinase